MDNYQPVPTKQEFLKLQQVALEGECLALGVEKYLASLSAGEDTLQPGQRLIKAAVLPLAECIRTMIEEALDGKAGRSTSIAKFLAQFSPERAAFIVARRVIHSITDKILLSTAAIQVANALEDCLNHDALEAEAPLLYKQLCRKIQHSNDEGYRHIVMKRQQEYAGVATIKWGVTEKARMGTTLIHLMVESTGLIEVLKMTRGHNDTPNYITASAKTMEWLELAHARCSLMQPTFMPMVSPPIPWTGPYGGGYLTKELRFPLIKTANKNYLEELRHWDMPDVYRSINALQDTAWSVNTGVLRVAREIWDGGGRVGGLPTREPLPLPPKFHDPETEPEKHKAWKKAAAQTYEENIRLVSKRLGVETKLHIAEVMGEYEQFHFPHALDWRGRAYPVSSMLNPQGDDLAKALLTFAAGKPLGEHGATWLAVHGANCFGVDKVPFGDRVQWVLDHRDQILECAFNPTDGSLFWAEADSPYMFLAFCFEWAGYTMQGSSFLSHLPVSWDGTCNGLQNFSAMLRDEVGGKAVNLVPSDTPSDVYRAVAEVAQKSIDLDAAAGDCPVAERWVGKLTRKWTKRNTMTVPYGVSKYGMRNQLREEFSSMRLDGDLSGPTRETEMEDAAYIAEKNHTAIGQVVVAARVAMQWLMDAAKVAASDGLPVRWVTPSGLLVQQAYRVAEGKDLDFNVAGRRYRMVLNITGHKINKVAQKNGISPNFIHSLDAAHMMRTVNYCLDAGLKDFCMIHDSYGAHAAEAEELSYHLRRAFMDQYRGDILKDFRDQLAEQLPDELAATLPPLPPMGTLDLEAVMESDYFFA
jgi:DNA-directed RNA polymerase